MNQFAPCMILFYFETNEQGLVEVSKKSPYMIDAMPN